MTSEVEPVDTDLETAQQSEGEPFLHSVTSSTPWWVVSVLLHVLVIALAGLVSMAIQLPSPDDSVIVITNICKPPEIASAEKPQPDSKEILNSSHTADATDKSATNASDIEVPDELKAFAVYGDHWETNNPLEEDKHTAKGTPDAHMFMFKEGSLDKKGGGGFGGVSLNDVVGVGGQASPGSGGGWGGGTGGGIGNDDGTGHGPFGRPDGAGRLTMIMRHGGNRGVLNSADAALRWLAYHQEADGHWDTMKYGSGQKTDTAMTGMALLAFLGAGHSEKVGPFKDNVKRAVGWLKSKQQPSGMIFDPTDAGAHRGIGYPTAIATLAIVEAAAMANIDDTRTAAQKAINYCMEHQCGEGSDKLGWRYGPKQPGDTSVTGWFVMALKSAKVAGLKIDHSAFDGALRFLQSVEIKNDGGDTSYGPNVHYGYMPGDAHATSAHRLTAIGNLIQIFMGAPKEQVQGSVEWFVNKGGVPTWGANGETVDMYYWYYGSLCTYQVGGDVWKRWNVGMMKALTENQVKQGDDAGSWPIVGEFSGEWGRVGQTALGCLSLEVYYRYKQTEQMKN